MRAPRGVRAAATLSEPAEIYCSAAYWYTHAARSHKGDTKQPALISGLGPRPQKTSVLGDPVRASSAEELALEAVEAYH